MGIHIEDGSGQGYSVKVNSKNELATSSTTRTEEHQSAIEEGDAYIVSTLATADTLTLATGNTYNFLYIKNTSTTKKVVLQKVGVSTSVAGCVLKWIKNPIEGVITNAATETAINSNFSSGNVAEMTAYSWDEVGTTGITGLTAGTGVVTFILPSASIVFPVDGSIVLQTGDSILWAITNGTGGNVEASMGARIYYDEE
jgi:hypothetical protein